MRQRIAVSVGLVVPGLVPGLFAVRRFTPVGAVAARFGQSEVTCSELIFLSCSTKSTSDRMTVRCNDSRVCSQLTMKSRKVTTLEFAALSIE